jgi:hypothetical protein
MKTNTSLVLDPNRETKKQEQENNTCKTRIQQDFIARRKQK